MENWSENCLKTERRKTFLTLQVYAFLALYIKGKGLESVPSPGIA